MRPLNGLAKRGGNSGQVSITGARALRERCVVTAQRLLQDAEELIAVAPAARMRTSDGVHRDRPSARAPGEARQRAAKWLRLQFSSCDEVPAAEIASAARRAFINIDLLRLVAREMGVEFRRRGRASSWARSREGRGT